MGLNVSLVEKQLQQDPTGWISIIVANNPDAVADRLQSIYSRPVDRFNQQSIIDEILDLLQSNPSRSGQALYDVLGVNVIDSTLTDVGRELFLKNQITNQDNGNRILKSAGGPFTDDSDLGGVPVDGENDPWGLWEVTGSSSGPSGETSDGEGVGEDNSGFNWNGILNTFAGSILNSIFGSQPNANPGGGAPNNNNNNNNDVDSGMPGWVWIVIILILLGVVAWALLR